MTLLYPEHASEAWMTIVTPEELKGEDLIPVVANSDAVCKIMMTESSTDGGDNLGDGNAESEAVELVWLVMVPRAGGGEKEARKKERRECSC